jgi:hypothetical protein
MVQAGGVAQVFYHQKFASEFYAKNIQHNCVKIIKPNVSTEYDFFSTEGAYFKIFFMQ